jgi:hypothetical protein
MELLATLSVPSSGAVSSVPSCIVNSDENFPEKFKSENFPENFPFFIRTVDMISLFTFYTVIIMLIYTSPFILIGR